jgi:hypothetical protein
MRVYDVISICGFREKYDFDVYVEAELTWGGSNAHGSTDPEWYECEIINICNPNRNHKQVSFNLYKALMEDYEDLFVEYLVEERGNYYEEE